MKGNLLITGAAGFIGRNIASEAVALGYKVTGLDAAGDKLEGAEFFRGDIRDKELVAKLAKGKDYVIHLAAITSNIEFEKDPSRCYDINVNGFLNVIDAAARSKCKKFVYASSASVYSESFSEETVIDIKKQKNHYAKTKLINEMIADSYHNVRKLETIGLRYFNVYGQEENSKGDYASIISRFVQLDREGKQLEIYGDGQQSRDFVYVKDIAKITLGFLEKGGEGVYNVGTGKSTSFNEIARLINKDKIVYAKNPLTSYQLYTRADNSKLLGLFKGYKFTEIKEGVGILKNSR